MSLQGVSDGTWSVFAEKVVRERDDARDEAAQLKAQLAVAMADFEQSLVALKAYYHECRCQHEAMASVTASAYAVIQQADRR